MRIALFTGNYNHIADGVSLTLNRLVSYLEKSGVQVLVFGPSVPNPPVKHNGELCEVPSIPAIGRPEYRISLGLGRSARRRLAEFNPDIIHIATPDLLGLMALRYGTSHHIPVVSTYHTHFASYLKYYGYAKAETLLWKYLKWFYNKCEGIYVPSQSMLEVLAEHEIDQNVKIWARGIETDLFHPKQRSAEWRTGHGFSADDFVVLFVSRLVWEKGLKTVVHSVEKAMGENPAIKCCIVGDGPAKEEMQRLLPSAVYTGHLSGEELYKAYAGSDAFLFPSDTETFGNVTLEALSSGLPAIVADATGSRSLVQHGINGFIAEVGNTNDFCRYMNLLCTDKKLCKELSHNARSIAEQYDWNHILNTMLSYYNAINNSGNLKLVA